MSITESIRKMTPNEAMCYDMGFENGIKVALETTSCITLDRLRELVAAERDGRVVVLPCKAGDTVWINFTPKRPANPEHKGKWFTREVEIERVKIGVKGLSFQTYLKSFALSELGKTVFLTRAEAEAAMKGATHDA